MFKGSCLYVTSPLKSVETYFMAQKVVSFYKCTLYPVVIIYVIKSLLCFLFLCLLDLSVTVELSDL